MQDTRGPTAGRTLTTVRVSTVTTAHVSMVWETSRVAVWRGTQADTVRTRWMSAAVGPVSTEAPAPTLWTATSVAVPLVPPVSPYASLHG